MKACFLDRDGVIIKDKNYLKFINQIEYTKGIFAGLKKIINKNYFIFIITNQSGVSRGYFSEKKLNSINKNIKKRLNYYNIPVKGIKYCPCHPLGKIIKYKKNCFMRKPNPGMINYFIKKYNINRKQSFLIGDKKSDILAGKRAKLKNNFIFSDKINFEFYINNLIKKKKI
jgi:D,D-heptose 1,7-bisphosphate phosphatase